MQEYSLRACYSLIIIFYPTGSIVSTGSLASTGLLSRYKQHVLNSIDKYYTIVSRKV
ncbi:hypothetical protein RhiirC2_763967 [Rhizophagus irregularis]|uniref:Uncharacterized protein n=1 Tax=Rhizophagus irregularis TaxID=588596 RepID=A0A2N1M6Y7_9GLOM|nr:hypothetical protein RhiirC2_763967 [Rhizophagus irregularis]